MEDKPKSPLKKKKKSNSDSFDKEYWWSRTPEERFAEIERLRRKVYGKKATGSVKRILEVVRYE